MSKNKKITKNNFNYFCQLYYVLVKYSYNYKKKIFYRNLFVAKTFIVKKWKNSCTIIYLIQFYLSFFLEFLF